MSAAKPVWTAEEGRKGVYDVLKRRADGSHEVRRSEMSFEEASQFALQENAAPHAAELARALVRANSLFRDALPKFNWGASALDARAIGLLSEVPREVSAALLKVDPSL